MKTPKSKLEAIDRYNKKNTVTLCIRLHKKNDADIIDALAKADSKQGYIKDLIRQDQNK